MGGRGDDGDGSPDRQRSGGVERFLSAAFGLGVDVEPRSYPQGTRTAADAAAAIGCRLDQIVKSLVFVADGEPVLALTSGANRIDPAALAAALEAGEVRKADADEARDATGYTIGGTPPFGHVSALRTVIDPHLLSFETVYAAAGSATDNFAISPIRLVEVTGGQVVDVTE